MAEVEYGEYKIRKGSRLAYNDGTGPKVAREGDTVTIPKHQAEGSLASRLEYPDGRPVERSRWSMADIKNASPEDRADAIARRRQQLDRERAELDQLDATNQTAQATQTTAKQQRRQQLNAGE